MKITIENTSRIVEVRIRAGADPIPCRIWEGQTESGIKVQVLITRIAALAEEDLSQFDAELQECKTPSAESQAFPLRMIL